MPNRIIREGILRSRAVGQLSEAAEMFYWHLLLVVDDYGRIEADPEMLRAACFPRRLATWTVERVSDALHETAECLTDDGEPLVLVYQVTGKKRKFLQVNNFRQRTRSKTSRCPSPDGHVSDTCYPYSETYSETETYSDNTVSIQESPVDPRPSLPPTCGEPFEEFIGCFLAHGKALSEAEVRGVAMQWVSMTDADQAAALAAAKTDATGPWKMREDPQFIPHPRNYLRERPWERVRPERKIKPVSRGEQLAEERNAAMTEWAGGKA